jgi:ubiquitin thioesterase protein OTUB1
VLLHTARALAEYANGARIFVDKISALQSTYASMRRTRGDGNCFFRSFIYAFLERLLLQSQEAEAQR